MRQAIDYVDFCRALGDETRQKLLRLLKDEGEQCVGCLVDRFGLSQPTISHHLLLLKRAGLVKSLKAGKQVFYAIDQENVVECCGADCTRWPGGQWARCRQHARISAFGPLKVGGAIQCMETRSFSPKQRDVFDASASGKSYDEIAQLLGTTRVVVAKRLHDARQRLRKILLGMVADRRSKEQT